MEYNTTTREMPARIRMQHVELWYKVILLSIVVISIPLNIIVVVRSTLPCARRHRRRRSSRDVMIASMAGSDIFQAAVGYVLQYVAIHSDEVSPAYCQISSFSVTFLALASMNHIVALSVDSYLHICKPWLTAKIVTLKKRIRLFFPLAAWLYAFTWAVVPFIGWHGYAVVEGGNCSLEWNTKRSRRQIYIIGLLIFCFLVPVVTIVMTFTLTQLGLGKMRKFAVDRFGLNSVVVLQNIEAEKKNIKMSLTIASAFVFAWTPYATVSVLQLIGINMHGKNLLQTLVNAAGLFAKSSIISNPVIYTIMRPKFRQAVSRKLSLTAATMEWPKLFQMKNLRTKNTAKNTEDGGERYRCSSPEKQTTQL